MDFWKEFSQNELVQRLGIIIIGVIVVLTILYYLKLLLKKKIIDEDQKYRAKKAANLLGYILTLSIVLFVFNDKLGNIGMALGLAGAGIAFALQEVITSFAGWISILLSNNVKIGQRVNIGGITGDIIDIGVLKTTIMEIGEWVNADQYNGRITTIANSFVFKEPIRNYSADYPFLWDEIVIPIRTESDFEFARSVFLAVAMEICGDFASESKETWKHMKDKFRIEDANVDPIISLFFDENWISFTIRYVVDFRKRRSTKDQLYTRLLQEILKSGNRIMIASSSMEITNIVPK